MKTKHKEGFTRQEIDKYLKQYPQINEKKFNDALMGITGMIIDGELIVYHHDVELALRCGLGNRNLTVFEWD